MNVGTVCLICLWLSIGGLPLIGRISAQRKQRIDGKTTTVISATPTSLSSTGETSILQSPGKRSLHGSEIVSLSEELDMVEAEADNEKVSAAGPKPEDSKKSPTSAVTVVPLVTGSSHPVAKNDSFRSYMERHRKKYYAQYRAERRRNAFMDNLEEIKEHNKEFAAGKNRFRLASNVFADMQNSEYRKRLIRLKMDPHRKVSPTMTDEIVSASSDALPESLDWREQGFKTPLANQKSCGSCYAFSIAYAISAQLMKHIGRVELVSEQQMVDCSTATGNLGCGGGSLRNTLKYLEQTGGVMRASDYPYTSSLLIALNGMRFTKAALMNVESQQEGPQIASVAVGRLS